MNGFLLYGGNCIWTKAEATSVLNKAFALMYSSGFWINSTRAKQLGLSLHFFLGTYHKLAFETHAAGKHRYAFVSKMHCLAHIAVGLKRQSEVAEFAENPLATSVQLQEDFIGRPARLSRRVDLRQIHRNVVSRTLILAQKALSNSDLDDRHMNAYED